MVSSSAAITALTALVSTPVCSARCWASPALVKVSFTGFSAGAAAAFVDLAAGLAAAVFFAGVAAARAGFLAVAMMFQSRVLVAFNRGSCPGFTCWKTRREAAFFTAFVVRADGSILAIGRSFWPLAQPFRWLLTAFSTDCYDLILKKTLEIMANPVKRPGWRCADPIKSSAFDVAVAGNPFREGFSCREPGTQGATPAVPDACRDPGPSAPSVRCPGQGAHCWRHLSFLPSPKEPPRAARSLSAMAELLGNPPPLRPLRSPWPPRRPSWLRRPSCSGLGRRGP